MEEFLKKILDKLEELKALIQAQRSEIRGALNSIEKIQEKINENKN
jgi:archaellum component FlaC